MRIINDFNLRKQSQDLGIKIWQTPGFLFIMIGIIAISVMTATYFISKNYDDPQILIVAECGVVIVILAIGTFIVRFVEQITRLNKMKTEFVSVASHQLRTPLSAIKWETELLLTKFKKGMDKNQLKNVENISVLAQRMVKLVNDLLDVAKIDQNRFVLKKQKIDLIKMTEETLKEMAPSFQTRHIEVNFSLKKKTPMAVGDLAKVKLVVENLINNAFKYTPSGGKVDIRLFRQKDCIIFEIKDNGVGIPKEQSGQVFEKFFRSDNAVKYQTEGTGLGLYIAKNVVEQLGGKIWFESIENVGSVFSFSLPVANNLLIK